jgi:signal transduction histidine kinase
MVVENCLGQKLSDIFNRQEATEAETIAPQGQATANPETLAQQQLKAQGEWFGAISALESLLLSLINLCDGDVNQYQGLLLAGPSPVVSHPDLIARLHTGIFTSEAFQHLSLIPFLPACSDSIPASISQEIGQFPLFPKDPIAREQFCLVFTPHFGLLMVLGEDSRGLPAFEFSFEPEIIQQAWSILRSRLSVTRHHQLQHLDSLIEQFATPSPDYRLVMEFSRQLLKHLPNLPPLEVRTTRLIETIPDQVSSQFPQHHLGRNGQEKARENKCPDLELLQALTHEIRTPLTTIRTLARLLLKRAKLTPDIAKNLEVIDQECTEQINRMELIFRAAELENTALQNKQVQLVSISLEQIFANSIPRWQKQAQRRNVILDVVLPKKLPQVVTDSAMLDQVLTGLMEKFTRSLPTGGHIRVEVTTAGHQLKLQFRSECTEQINPFKALGNLLMFQPATGSLSLNLDVTKNLFHALGGKLIVRQRPEQGETFTIFLPLGNPQAKVNK